MAGAALETSIATRIASSYALKLEADFRQNRKVARKHQAVSRDFTVGQLHGLPLVRHGGFD